MPPAVCVTQLVRVRALAVAAMSAFRPVDDGLLVGSPVFVDPIHGYLSLRASHRTAPISDREATGESPL